jgi:hypothetical protein
MPVIGKVHGGEKRGGLEDGVVCPGIPSYIEATYHLPCKITLSFDLDRPVVVKRRG